MLGEQSFSSNAGWIFSLQLKSHQAEAYRLEKYLWGLRKASWNFFGHDLDGGLNWSNRGLIARHSGGKAKSLTSIELQVNLLKAEKKALGNHQKVIWILNISIAFQKEEGHALKKEIHWK